VEQEVRSYPHLREGDPEVWRLVLEEGRRQQEGLELIASENFTSLAVLEAMGTCLTNKYAEGTPGRRYYGGCEVVDRVEELARERACRLFGAEHANVQPHSGAQANMAVYLAALKPGDAVLGMDLSHGGHLTHGSPVNFSGILYRFYGYGVDPETETVDFDGLLRLAREVRPRLIVAGASAYPRTLDFARFSAIAREVGAELMVDMAHIAGLVAAGLHPNPTPQADYVTSTTHKTLRGPRGGFILCPASRARAVDKAVFPGVQGGPLMHVIAAKAVCFGEALTDGFRRYQEQVVRNARALATGLMERGFQLVSGGTDTHLLLVKTKPLGLTGKEAEEILGRAGITVNKNAIPFDPEKPAVTSGIRLGTPALTTRGMKEREMEEIADLIYRCLASRGEERVLGEARKKVAELCTAFPLPYPRSGEGPALPGS